MTAPAVKCRRCGHNAASHADNDPLLTRICVPGGRKPRGTWCNCPGWDPPTAWQCPVDNPTHVRACDCVPGQLAIEVPS